MPRDVDSGCLSRVAFGSSSSWGGVVPKPIFDHVPSGLPILAKGHHRQLEDGACLMEYTSVLAGEAWSDSPPCTHPVLAAIARGVNDSVDDDTRQLLSNEAARLARAQSGDPRVGPQLVLMCARRAAACATEDGRVLRRIERRATRCLARMSKHMQRRRTLLPRSTRPRVFDLRAREMYVPLSLATIAHAKEPAALVILLRDCICLVHEASGRDLALGRRAPAIAAEPNADRR
jgi:hypothetical protein